MSVKLRFRRMGRKQLPVFGLVATDSRSPRDGRFIEDLGRYRPIAEPATFSCDTDRVLYWLGQGAQPSDTVRNLLQKEGILLRWALTRQGKEAEEIETAVTEFRERQEAKSAGKVKKTRAERRAEALQAEKAAAKEKAAEIAKQRAEREAELAKQREEAEAEARKEAEAAREEAAAAAADSEALTEAADAAATGGADSQADTDAATSGDAVEQTSSQADGDGDTADQQAQTEAADGDDAVAKASPDDVPAEAPAAAKEQPAATDATTEEVAADTAQAVADQTEAGAQQEDAVTDEPATEAPDTDGTAGDEPTSETPATDDAPDATPAEAASGKPDKLTTLSGIGPKYAGILTDAGITTFAQLAEKSTEELQQIVADAGSSSAGSEDTWAKQAELLAAGDTDGHAAYVESLKS